MGAGSVGSWGQAVGSWIYVAWLLETAVMLSRSSSKDFRVVWRNTTKG